MAYSDKIRSALRLSFVEGHPLKTAAALNHVPYETARGWKRKAKADGDDWDRVRAANRISPGGTEALTTAVLEDFIFLFQSTLDGLKEAEDITPLAKAETLAKLSDAYQKTIKAAGASSPTLSKLAIALDVLKMQLAFIKDKYPQNLTAYMEMLEPFGEQLSHELR